MDFFNQGIQKLNQHISSLNDNITSSSNGPAEQILKVGHRTCRIEKQLAEGGFGFVYEVTDLSSNHRFALKKQTLQSDNHKRQVKNEVDLWQKISQLGSNNIVRLQDVFYDQNWAYILSELCPNGTLFDILEKYDGKMQERQIVYILIEICEGLRVMHSFGIAHRDIKLENVLLSQNRFKICDFGSATTATLDPTRQPVFEIDRMMEQFEKFTTMMYRPPEMIDRYLKYKVDTQADVWMLGCLAFTLCFALHPFQDAQKIAILNTQYFMPDEDFDRISVKMRNLVSNMLVPNPAERPTVTKLLEILKQWDSYPQVSLSPSAEGIRNKNSGGNKPAIPGRAPGMAPKKGDITPEDFAQLQEKIRKEQENKSKKKQHIPINQQSYYNQKPAQAAPQRQQQPQRQAVPQQPQKSEQFDFFSFDNGQKPAQQQPGSNFAFDFGGQPKAQQPSQQLHNFDFSSGRGQPGSTRPNPGPKQGEADLLDMNQPQKPAGDLFTELKDVNFNDTGSQPSPQQPLPQPMPAQQQSGPQQQQPQKPSNGKQPDDEIYDFFKFS